MWERVVHELLQFTIERGVLQVTFADGRTRRYGETGTGPEVAIRITDPALYRKIALNPEMAVGEAFMDGTLQIEGDDLRGFLAVAIANIARERAPWWRRPFNQAWKTVQPVLQWNSASRARRRVAHHYDLSGELYDLFLDADKQYSCAYFARPDMTLGQAQEAKKALIARKLLIEPDMRVLDIGCGWGGLALTLARDHGARVTGVTLSEEQHRVARERAAKAGLSDRIDIRLLDYREVPETFDRVVSVGMFEHVGVPHYREYFRHVHDKLSSEGVALIHTIGRSSPPGYTSPWLEKYIFPGGYTPAMSEVLRPIEDARLWATDIEIWRLHYAETLRHWYSRFMENADRARALYDARFVRMWRFYLVACEMNFRHAVQCVFQFQLARAQDAVPLTRDYLYADAAPRAIRAAE